MTGERREVAIIGAGPAGSIAGALLRRLGRDVLVLERQRFPRFSIGESLLVHCLDFVAEAGMLGAVDAAGFQYKNGAAFARGAQYSDYDFGQRFTPGRPSTYQVQRAAFDKLLADEAARQGVEIRYEVETVAVGEANGRRTLTTRGSPEAPSAKADASQPAALLGASSPGVIHSASPDDALTAPTPTGRRSGGQGEVHTIEADFILDASGFGRTLPKLLGLEVPSAFPARQALFTHVTDCIPEGAFDRNKIRVTVHPEHLDVWYWLIPFAGGRSSLGVVARREYFERYPGPLDQRLRAIVAEDAGLAALLADAEWDTPVRELAGYAANVKTMHGPGFALLGNAAEFLDPVFSSGVTIAMRSASMAVQVLERQLRGERVDWQSEFEQPLRRGVDCFRAYVEAWYDGRFQKIVFHERQPEELKRMICSVLAGYAWDERNPFVAQARQRLDTLAKLCA